MKRKENITSKDLRTWVYTSLDEWTVFYRRIRIKAKLAFGIL